MTVLVAAPVASATGCGSGGSNNGTTNTGGSSGTSMSASSGTGTGATAATSSTTGTATGGATSSSGAGATGGATSSSGTTTTAASSSSSGSTTCGADDTACQNNGSDGLCKSTVCSPCTDVTDDASCTTAYGGATMPYLCLGGVCSPGSCRLDTDCPTGEICGLSAPNTCGKCTGDAQCQGDPTYAKDVCDIATGTCVANACTANDKACPLNGADFCCALSCIPGNCCTSTDCKNNAVCTGHTCTTCPAVTNDTYYVDPKNGDDSKGTGSNGTTGCAFQTITRALQYIGNAPAAGTKIEVLTTAPVSSTSTPSAETFPITVPANVTIIGSGGTATVNVPANSTGFQLTGGASGLSTLLIDGTSLPGTTGVVSTTGTTDGTTLTDVTVQNMASDGIDVVNKGILSIHSGVTSTKSTAGSGLHVNGTGRAIITTNTGDTAATFSKNGQHGILVQQSGSVTIGGTLDPAAIATGNTIAGLYIFQTPGVATVPANTVSNLQADGSVTGNGIHIFGGSSLKLRTSVSKNNKGSGVFITSYAVGTAKNDSVAQIDLGLTTDFGHNTLQFATGAQPNAGAGICLALTPTANQALNAAGNVFEAAQCFNTGTPGPIMKTATCTGGTDVAITGVATTNTIITSNCAQN